MEDILFQKTLNTIRKILVTILSFLVIFIFPTKSGLSKALLIGMMFIPFLKQINDIYLRTHKETDTFDKYLGITFWVIIFIYIILVLGMGNILITVEESAYLLLTFFIITIPEIVIIALTFWLTEKISYLFKDGKDTFFISMIIILSIIFLIFSLSTALQLISMETLRLNM